MLSRVEIVHKILPLFKAIFGGMCKLRGRISCMISKCRSLIFTCVLSPDPKVRIVPLDIDHLRTESMV